MPKRILLIGASSMLGHRFREELGDTKQLINQFNRPNASGISFSVTDPEKCIDNLSQIRPQVVINFAAATDVDRCETHKNEAVLVNAIIPKNIQEWAGSQKQKPYVIQLSTDQVYDGPGVVASKESEVSPVNIYGQSKLSGEQALDLDHSCIIRTNFFGKSINKKLSLTDWILSKYKTSDRIYGFSDVHFSPVSMATLISVIDRCISEQPLGVLNLGSESGISKYDFICRFLNRMNYGTTRVSKQQIDNFSELVRRPKNMIMNSNKIYSMLSLKPIDLDLEIHRVVREYQNEST